MYIGRRVKLIQQQRRTVGSSLVELPVMMWIIFALMLMPMLSLATIGLRCAFVTAAVQDGVHAAAKARTFEAGTTERPPALELADQTTRHTASIFTGITIDNVDTDILITDVNTGTMTRSRDKLTTPADSSRFIYQVETIVRGHVEPLYKLNSRWFGNVPALTAPVTVAYAAKQMFENPQGLNQ